jgi:hypothetical protein
LVASVALLAASLFLSARNTPVDVNFNRQGNFLLFYLAAFAGIGLCVTIARILPRIGWLEFCGRNAIVILAFHRPAGALVEHAAGRHLWTLPFRSYTSLLSYDLFHTAAAVALCAPIALAVERWWPGVIGRAERRV